jgi:hypothetical protein
MGMSNVQSFLHLLLVFKLHEDTVNGQFKKIAALEEKINNTLESSIDRVLGDGASRIGEEMGDAIEDRAERVLESFGEYRSLRGQTILVCFLCVTYTLVYWLGAAGFLASVPSEGTLEWLLFLPAGWSIFFCGATYTFLWVGDHWGRIKKTVLYKTFLGLQIFLLTALVIALL